MDEPLCFVHFIITLTCFQNKKRPFCFSKYFQQTATGATLESRQASALTEHAYPPGSSDANQIALAWWEDTMNS